MRHYKGLHNINAANVRSTKDLISQKSVLREKIGCKKKIEKIGCKTDTTRKMLLVVRDE